MQRNPLLHGWRSQRCRKLRRKRQWPRRHDHRTLESRLHAIRSQRSSRRKPDHWWKPDRKGGCKAVHANATACSFSRYRDGIGAADGCTARREVELRNGFDSSDCGFYGAAFTRRVKEMSQTLEATIDTKGRIIL